jgi:biopolymer transport protein ExbD
MGISVENSGRGRRKSLNAELLLVPYIDLLTCMVAFLLITAVWTQLARLEVRQKGQAEDETTERERPTKLAVLVHDEGFVIVADEDQQPVPRAAGAYDYGAVAGELKKIKALHPDKPDLQIVSQDAIPFDILVKTMDAAMSSGFPDLSLLDAGSSI